MLVECTKSFFLGHWRMFFFCKKRDMLETVVRLLWDAEICGYFESAVDCVRVTMTCRALASFRPAWMCKRLVLSSVRALDPSMPLERLAAIHIVMNSSRAITAAVTNWSAIVLHGDRVYPLLDSLTLTGSWTWHDHTPASYNLLESIGRGRFPGLRQLSMPLCCCRGGEGCDDDALKLMWSIVVNGSCARIETLDVRPLCAIPTDVFSTLMIDAMVTYGCPMAVTSMPFVTERPGISASSLVSLTGLVESGSLSQPRKLILHTHHMPDHALSFATRLVPFIETLGATIRPSPHLVAFLHALITSKTLKSVHLTFIHTPRSALDPQLLTRLDRTIPVLCVCTDSSSQWIHHELGR